MLRRNKKSKVFTKRDSESDKKHLLKLKTEKDAQIKKCLQTKLSI
jgi:hypothetical protein